METTGLLISHDMVRKVTKGDSFSINELVGGWFDAVTSTDTTVDLVGYVHDEGLLLGLPMNPVATALFGKIIVGPCVVFRCVNEKNKYDGEDYSLNEDDLHRITWLVGAYKMWVENHIVKSEAV